MKKKIILFAITLMLVFGLIGCNRQLIDTTYNYTTAIISLPNGEIVEGSVESWNENSTAKRILYIVLMLR